MYRLGSGKLFLRPGRSFCLFHTLGRLFLRCEKCGKCGRSWKGMVGGLDWSVWKGMGGVKCEGVKCGRSWKDMMGGLGKVWEVLI